jgi:valyl-tRNA synthetase
VFIPLGSLVNVDEEIERLEEKLLSLTNEINRCKKMLGNDNFLRKAPKEKIEEEQRKLTRYLDNYKEVENRIKELSN